MHLEPSIYNKLKDKKLIGNFWANKWIRIKRLVMTELTTKLSNVQMELLRLYSTNLSEDDLEELKLLLARFYGDKSIKLVNKVWDDKGLTDEDMDILLNNAAQ